MSEEINIEILDKKADLLSKQIKFFEEKEHDIRQKIHDLRRQRDRVYDQIVELEKLGFVDKI